MAEGGWWVAAVWMRAGGGWWVVEIVVRRGGRESGRMVVCGRPGDDCGVVCGVWCVVCGGGGVCVCDVVHGA